ncbi:holin [Bacillus sp. FJAT-42376]|uniref:phage holin family protein n=1 Tax=Bacillus sp. FJAT-42376 TaxID=2014076 RepID=UPI000F4FAA90|nr:phage holin family protein [Bacillus sp. FJAT-42376]AZB44076.1 holin [Bacillus sp. FJAT-42376]
MSKDAEVMTLYSFSMTFLTFLLGEIEQMMYVLFALMVIEFLSFTISKAISGQASIRAIGIQLLKKALILIMVAVANLLDKVIPIGISIRDFTVIFYIFYELLYIITNVSSSGLPVPQIVRDALDLLKSKVKK